MRDVKQLKAGNDNALNTCSVLVTRPEGQAEQLCRLIESSGGQAIRFPVIEILPASNISAAKKLIQSLADFDMAIFISANAVRFAMPLLPLQAQLPASLTMAAIGKATAMELRQRGIRIDISPETTFNSESLLSMPQMQQVTGKKIIIFKGEGGRDLLADTLAKRGATVSQANVYRRAMPDVDTDDLIQTWSNGGINVATVTSQQGLYNLSKMLGTTGQVLLQQTPLVVMSERMLAVTRELGIQSSVMVAEQASDMGVVNALIKLASIIKA